MSVLETIDALSKYPVEFRKQMHPYKDILELGIKRVYFARCPLKGWFVDHWALIIERMDHKFLTMQFLTLGIEIQRLSTLGLAKMVVARSSNATPELVAIETLGWSPLTIGELLHNALIITHGKTYNFIFYNCRSFVMDLLPKMTLINESYTIN